jgi:hypothetical protein
MDDCSLSKLQTDRAIDRKVPDRGKLRLLEIPFPFFLH